MDLNELYRQYGFLVIQLELLNNQINTIKQQIGNIINKPQQVIQPQATQQEESKNVNESK